MVSPLSSTLAEIDSVRRECLGLLDDLRQFHPPDPVKGTFPDTYRLLVTPMLYSAWERCFTICNAVVWRRLRDESVAAHSLTSAERAAWLMKTSFYQAFTQKLLNAANPGEDGIKLKKSHLPILQEFIGDLDHWLAAPLDPNVDTDGLVMTFSNVNADVVKINADVLGISSFPAFKVIKFGRLHDLVGRRNEIGHGGILSPPPSDQFNSLWEFTESLIQDYCEAFKCWLVIRFPSPQPPTWTDRIYAAAHRILKAFTK
jgi:hypothetical protein